MPYAAVRRRFGGLALRLLRHLPPKPAGGGLLHLVLLGSLEAYLAGWIGEAALLAIQVVNPTVPLLIVAAAMRSGTSGRASGSRVL